MSNRNEHVKENNSKHSSLRDIIITVLFAILMIIIALVLKRYLI